MVEIADPTVVTKVLAYATPIPVEYQGILYIEYANDRIFSYMELQSYNDFEDYLEIALKPSEAGVTTEGDYMISVVSAISETQYLQDKNKVFPVCQFRARIKADTFSLSSGTMPTINTTIDES